MLRRWFPGLAAIGWGTAVMACHAPAPAALPCDPPRPRTLVGAVRSQTPAPLAELTLAVRGKQALFPGVRSDTGGIAIDRIQLALESSAPIWLWLVPETVCRVGVAGCPALTRATVDAVAAGQPLPTGILDLGSIAGSAQLDWHTELPSGRLMLVRVPEARRQDAAWVVRGDVQITTGTRRREPVGCAATSDATIALRPTAPHCGNGWIEAGERCDTGSATDPSCPDCEPAAARCGPAPGGVYTTTCRGEPSRCTSDACTETNTCPSGIPLEVDVVLGGRTVADAPPVMHVSSPFGHDCGCKIADGALVCGPACAAIVPACEDIRLEFELAEGEAVHRWSGCTPDSGGCALEPEAVERRVAVFLSDRPSSRIDWMWSTAEEVHGVRVAAGTGIAVAQDTVRQAVTVPGAGGTLFRHATRLVALTPEGKLRWESLLGGLASHVQPDDVVTLPDGSVVFAGSFPAASPVIETRRRARRVPSTVSWARTRRTRVVRFSPDGEQAWSHTPRRSGSVQIAAGSEGTVLLAISPHRPHARELDLAVMSSDGRALWSTTVSAQGDTATLRPLAIALGERGDVLVAGTANGPIEGLEPVGPQRFVLRWPAGEPGAPRGWASPVRSLEQQAALAQGGASVWLRSGVLERFDAVGKSVHAIEVGDDTRCSHHARVAATSDGGTVLLTVQCTPHAPDLAPATVVGFTVRRLDAAGQLAWVERYDGDDTRPGFPHPTSLSVGPDDAPILAGRFAGDHRLGAHVLSGVEGSFVVQLRP